MGLGPFLGGGDQNLMESDGIIKLNHTTTIIVDIVVYSVSQFETIESYSEECLIWFGMVVDQFL